MWDVAEGKVVYKLPGHKGSVTGVDMHPRSVSLSEIKASMCLSGMGEEATNN